MAEDLSPSLYTKSGKGSGGYLEDIGNEQGSLTLLVALLQHAMTERVEEGQAYVFIIPAALPEHNNFYPGNLSDQ
ncbi:MAG: hypothetical protein Q9181_007072 [Wetmoreana brouardii]